MCIYNAYQDKKMYVRKKERLKRANFKKIDNNIRENRGNKREI